MMCSSSAAVLRSRKIAEMRTGEGDIGRHPAAYLNALEGKGAHLVRSPSTIVARHDARWMAPIYHALGLSVGVLQMAAATENGRVPFFMISKLPPHREDAHQLR